MNLIVIEGDAEPRVCDLEIALRLEFERPRSVRQLIERNRSELERHGNLPQRVANSGPGRPSGEYWLNEAQAILIAMKSDAPKAEDARSEIIAVFQAWRRGKSAPVSVQITLDAIGELFDRKLTPIHQEIADIRGNVTYLAKRVDDIVPRREFPEEVKRQWRHLVARRYAGECPRCRSIAIIDASGSAIAGVLHYDHYRGRELNGPADGWPVCVKCNLKLREADFKNASRKHFEVFHDYRKEVFAGHIPKQLRAPNKDQGSLF